MTGILWASFDDGATHVAMAGDVLVGDVRRDDFDGGWFWVLFAGRATGRDERLELAKTALAAAFFGDF